LISLFAVFGGNSLAKARQQFGAHSISYIFFTQSYVAEISATRQLQTVCMKGCALWVAAIMIVEGLELGTPLENNSKAFGKLTVASPKLSYPKVIIMFVISCIIN